MTSSTVHPDTISKAQAGDAWALNFIVQSYIPLVKWFVFRTCRGYGLWDLYDDMFSYVLPKILLAISSYDPSRGSFNHWLTYYIRSSVRTFRGMHKYDCLNDDISIYADELVDTVDISDSQQFEFEDEVSNLFQNSNLSPRKLQILKLRHFADYTYDDIADVYHLTREGARQATKKAEMCMRKVTKELDTGYVP